MRYLLNINGRTVHNANSKGKRCKIHLIAEENKAYFDSFQEAMNYLPKGNKPTKACTFCLGRDYNAK